MRLCIGHIEAIDDDMARALRDKTPWERLAIADGILRSARKLIAASLRDQHPEWSAAEVAAEVSRRLSHGTH